MLKNLIITSVFSFLCSIPCIALSPFQRMSIEEKVGQLLIAHFHGDVANEEAKTLVQELGIGGIIYYNWANGLNSPQQVQSLSLGLQKLTKDNRFPILLFIAVDQEGGVVARLKKGFTEFPGNKALGETNQPNLAEAASLAMGQELKAVGVNLNFAPVIDININPYNPIIGIRSFGDDPEKVYDFGAKALKGFREAGIITTLKHFPGHGDVKIDSHKDLPIIHKSLEELERFELLPFTKLASSAEMIMTAHLLVPALDDENCSTLSEKTLNFLKNKIGFQGVIITDSLVMEGVLKRCQTIDEAAIQSLNAGCDILLLGGKQLIGGQTTFELTVSDIKRIHGSIVRAIKSGRISEKRLNEATEKILKLKERFLDSEISDSLRHLSDLVNTPDHQEIAQKIASQALKIVSESNSIPSLSQKKITLFAPELLHETINQTSFFKIGKETASWFFEDLNPSDKEIEAAQQLAKTADVLLIFSYNAWKNRSQEVLIHSLINTGKPHILLMVRDPIDASLFPKAHLILNTFSPTKPSLEAAFKLLMEKNK